MNVFHFTATKYALLALQDRRLKIARIHELNDPFELFGAALAERAHRKNFKAFKDWVADRYGLLCFSRGWTNPVLWSHYADRHRGVALEFWIHDDDISEINYTPNRILIDVENALRRGTFTKDEAFALATTKFKHWQYEDEVRVFCPLAESQLVGEHYFERFTERMKLVGLIRGPACTLSNEEIAASLLSNNEISVTQSRLAFNTFNVVRKKDCPIELIRGAGQLKP